MIPIALSPCPNDTFLFQAWLRGKVGHELPPLPHFADIETLNQWALAKRFPLLKVSFGTLPQLLHDYWLLPVGAALGHGCGPKLVSRTPFSLEELPSKKIALPGKQTTAHFLFEKFFPHCPHKYFCFYHEIFSLLKNGDVDCGVIIHESRFTFQQAGFYEIADLGLLWESSQHLPLSLGCLIASRTLPMEQIQQLITILRLSFEEARASPEEALKFAQTLSQEKDLPIIRQHIDLYVNEETHTLSSKGLQAIKTLLSLDLPESFWVFPNETSTLCYTT